MNPLKLWRAKGLIQKALSITPGGIHINDMLQRTIGGLKRFDENISIKADDLIGIINLIPPTSNFDFSGATVLEIGSGWYPTLPLCLSLLGAKKITTVDLQRHMNPGLTFRAVRSLSHHLERIAKATDAPIALVQDRYEILASCGTLDALLSAARIEYLAPADATRLVSIPNSTFDLVYSNSVLEHVPRDVIVSMMHEASRVLKDDGLMVHAVACNDHYAHFDRSISFINFLAFDEEQWKLWNNSIQFQNRMRAPEFLDIARGCGFRILHEARAVRPGTREALRTMRIAKEFEHFSTDDLAATTVDFVARKDIAPRLE